MNEPNTPEPIDPDRPLTDGDLYDEPADIDPPPPEPAPDEQPPLEPLF